MYAKNNIVLKIWFFEKLNKKEKNSSVWFWFMRLTHTISILKNSELELVAIVEKLLKNTRKNLTEQAGNFSTGTLGEDLFSKIKN